MKSYDEFKARMKTIQRQMIDGKRNERTDVLKKVKQLCKGSGFTAGMLKVNLMSYPVETTFNW